MHMVGLRFHIEMDHKPLISLFSTKTVDELPPHSQTMRICILHRTSWLHALTRRSCTWPTHCHESWQAKGAPVELHGKLGVKLQNDSTTAKVMHHCQSEWPALATLNSLARQYGFTTDHNPGAVSEAQPFGDPRVSLRQTSVTLAQRPPRYGAVSSQSARLCAVARSYSAYPRLR